MTTPTRGVWVALATYRGERHLGAQLATLVDQTHLPDGLVVRDDGSDDATVAMLRDFAASAPFEVRIIEGDHVGLARSLEHLLEQCPGEVVALCDQDDEWDETKLDRLFVALASHPEAVAAVSDGLLVDVEGREIGGTTFQALGFTPHLRHQFVEDPVRVLAHRSVVTGHASAFRRSVIEAALPFPDFVTRPGAPLFADRWLSLVAAGLGAIAVVDHPLVRHRQHDGQVTGIDARAWVQASREARRWGGQLRGSGPDAFRGRARERARILDAAAERTSSPSLAAAAAHLARRAEYPRNRLTRPSPVWAELRSGGYEWSGGAKVALADLVRPFGEESVGAVR